MGIVVGGGEKALTQQEVSFRYLQFMKVDSPGLISIEKLKSLTKFKLLIV